MALGWDQAVAQAALNLDCPLMCAIPFKGQEWTWPEESRRRYAAIVERAEHVHVVSDGGYGAYKMQIRNEWMVDRSERVCALWNGTDGGTANCVAYANRMERPLDNLWDRWKQMGGGQ
jgi:uncharacterized phage-like protein YoqJ